MTDWVINLVESGGYLAIAFLMFLENVIPPIPSEVIMPLAGFASTRGEISPWLAWLAGTIGSVVGQLPLFYLARWAGSERIAAWADKHGKWLMLDGDDVRKADAWFDKHGGKAVFFGRFAPGVRTFVSLPAGAAGMSLVKFLTYSTLGMGLWAGGLLLAGYLLGDQWERVGEWMGPATYVVAGILAIVVIVFVVRRKLVESEKS